MIYLVTKQQELFNDDTLYTKVSIEQVIEYLESKDEVSFDSETTGLDCHRDRLYCIQVGDQADQYIIDCNSIDIKALKHLLESRLLILQNGKFDLKFLYKQGIHPRKIYDTFVVERVLFCGIDDHRAGLEFLAYRYLGIKLDKTQQKNINQEGLTSENIKYAADDIALLAAIRGKQIEALNEKGLAGTANLENRFTPCLAYIEYCGFKLDVSRWKAKMKKDNERLLKAADTLNNWVISRNLVKFMKPQLSLFEPLSSNINWMSPKQVIPLFESLGINCTIMEKGKEKKSVEEGVIKKQAKKFPIIDLYLEYRGCEKVVSTYGQNFLDQINPVTGRIHTSFKQIMNTGRISSGGKDKSTGEEYINFQNIPADKETRACFVAALGNTLIISDYSGQEQIVLANRSMDTGLLEFYDKGLADMHSFVAGKMFPELEGLPVEEIKEKHKDKRNKAKNTGFAINYGGAGTTIADNLGITKEEGDAIYNAYFVAFPGLGQYFEESKKQGLRDGYILISPVTGRKSYIDFFDQYKALERTCNYDFWNRYRKAKATNSRDFPELKKLCTSYFKMKGEIERCTLNYPIQGTSADITKISCIYIYDYIADNDLFDTVLFVNTVHDENVLECPVEMGNTVSEMVRESMCKAGDIFCKRVPLKADPEQSFFWKK